MSTTNKSSLRQHNGPTVAPGDPIIVGVHSYFEESGWPPRQSSILVALSGGIDSVALLIALRAMSAEHEWRLGGAHVNYHLRGSESDGDEVFCRDVCARLGIPFHVHQAHRPAGESINVQSWAREERYAFFERLMQSDGYDLTAVAHTLDDRAESVAAAVIEARGTFALSGIPPRRGQIIRPLFAMPRSEIAAFAERHSLEFRVDSSNASSDYLRNRIRHEFLPHWADINPSITRGLARLSEQLQKQEAFLLKEAMSVVNDALLDSDAHRVRLNAVSLEQCDSALDPFLLRILARQVGITSPPTSDTAARFSELRLRRHAGRIEQGALVIERSKTVLTARNESFDDEVQPDPTTLTVGKETVIGRLRVMVHRGGPEPARRLDDRVEAMFDWNCLMGPLVLRGWQYGDRYRPIGLSGEKTLARLLADRGVPRDVRSSIPVLTDAQGILWPIGHPIADRAKLTTATHDVLHVKVSRS